MSADRPAAVIVLAAGGGTRMKSAKPKVLHRIGGRSLVAHALYAASGLDPQHLAVVVRHGRDEVDSHLRDVAAQLGTSVVIADQDEVAGTGRAVQCGLEALPSLDGAVVVTYGDVPLQTTETLASLLAAHREKQSVVTILTAEVPDPYGYGRVLRNDAGAVAAVVEEKDASDEERLVREINSGIFVFDAHVLRAALERVGTDNAQGEMYLTDVVAIVNADGGRIGAVCTDDVWQTEGVNTRSQLSTLGRELNRRVLEGWMDEGVDVVDPQTTWVDVTVVLASDVTLKPGVQLQGETTVEVGAVIGPDTTLADVEVGAGASVVRTQGSGARLAAGSKVGPFAYLRPGTVLGVDGKIGTFVETKQARIADGAKVPHLSYVGDAEIGEGTNIGAGTIFANYDGLTKNVTVVGTQCKTGSNNTFVAPVRIGDGAVTGGGTVVRRNVPPGALAVSTGPQRHIEQWVQRKRPGTAAAEAADAAEATAEERGK